MQGTVMMWGRCSWCLMAESHRPSVSGCPTMWHERSSDMLTLEVGAQRSEAARYAARACGCRLDAVGTGLFLSSAEVSKQMFMGYACSWKRMACCIAAVCRRLLQNCLPLLG